MNKGVLVTFGLLTASLCAAVAFANEPACDREPHFDVAQTFVSGTESPESVTTDGHGNLYLSQAATILRRDAHGNTSVFGTLPLPIFALGVKVGRDGCVYNASTSLSDVNGAFVWRLCSANSIELFAELDQTGAPNDLAFDHAGNMFVTDPVLGRIWKITPGGTPSVFADDPLLDGTPDDPALKFRALGANGIAFDAHERFLYVSNTDQGSIVRIPMFGAPTPELFAEDPMLRGSDGIAFDRTGTLFVAVNGLDSLATVDRRGDVELLASGAPLDGPSSLVFSAEHGKDTLFVVSSAFSRTFGFETGTPMPALLATRARAPGLPL